MAIGTAVGLSNAATIALAIVLAFEVGYSLAMIPLRRAGFSWASALRTAFAAESVSIAVMEIVDNVFMLVVPGAMDAGVASALFWGSLAASLLVAGVAAFPVNRWFISKGLGHALAHAPVEPAGAGTRTWPTTTPADGSGRCGPGLRPVSGEDFDPAPGGGLWA
jgi:hypothetical protein